MKTCLKKNQDNQEVWVWEYNNMLNMKYFDTSYEERRFTTLEITPSWKQFFVNEMPLLIICSIALFAAGLDNMPYAKIIFWIGVVLLSYLSYTLLYLLRIKYIITDQQIIYIHGVMGQAKDYMELYRVIDYREHSSLQQQIAGIKTITLYSGDHSLPKFKMLGIPKKSIITEEIRKRVEYNKQRKGIYEFTNR